MKKGILFLGGLILDMVARAIAAAIAFVVFLIVVMAFAAMFIQVFGNALR
jgi:hypothetical protein